MCQRCDSTTPIHTCEDKSHSKAYNDIGTYLSYKVRCAGASVGRPHPELFCRIASECTLALIDPKFWVAFSNMPQSFFVSPALRTLNCLVSEDHHGYAATAYLHRRYCVRPLSPPPPHRSASEKKSRSACQASAMPRQGTHPRVAAHS